MITDQYVWLLWSCAFLIPWILVYVFFPVHRQAMWWASLFTMPFGFTEPLFVPEYWSSPSLFDLAQNTGFEFESLFYCFGIGGIVAVFYNLVTGYDYRTFTSGEWRRPLHHHHYKTLAPPFIVFVPLYFFSWNPVYPSILAMLVGVITTVLCRADLKRKSCVGGLLFLTCYSIFLAGLEWSAPGYIDRVWRLEALSGLVIGFIPIGELLFAVLFGMYWSGVYEHFTWRRLAKA